MTDDAHVEWFRMSEPFTTSMYSSRLSGAACCHSDICSTARWLLLGGEEGIGGKKGN